MQDEEDVLEKSIINPAIRPDTEDRLAYLGSTERNDRYLKEGRMRTFVIVRALIEVSVETGVRRWRVALKAVTAVSGDRVMGLQRLVGDGEADMWAEGTGETMFIAYGEALAKLKSAYPECTITLYDATGLFMGEADFTGVKPVNETS